MTTGGAFWLHALFGFCALAFFWTLVPETRDRTLEEIEGELGISGADAALSRDPEDRPASVATSGASSAPR